MGESERGESAFQSTPLIRGETGAGVKLAYQRDVFQSTPLIRGETKALAESMAAESISIHSPHARGDFVLSTYYDIQIISIRSPLTRGDKLAGICLA